MRSVICKILKQQQKNLIEKDAQLPEAGGGAGRGESEEGGHKLPTSRWKVHKSEGCDVPHGD